MYLLLSLIVVATLVYLAAMAGYSEGRGDMKHLSGREQTIVAAAADAMFPAGGPIPISGTEAGAVRYIDAYVGRYSPSQRFLVRLMFTFIELSPVIFGPERGRFSRLPHATQLQFLDEMFTSQIYFRRVVFVSLRALLTMAYLSHPRVAAAMNMVFDPDPFGIGAQRQATRSGTRRRVDMPLDDETIELVEAG